MIGKELQNDLKILLFPSFQIVVEEVTPLGSAPSTISRRVHNEQAAGVGSDAKKVECLCSTLRESGMKCSAT